MNKQSIGDKINSMINGHINSINTIAIAKIVNVDNSNMMCDIKLLDMPEVLGVRNEVEIIENIPISPVFWGSKCKINAPLSAGDKVIVAFCQHDTFNARNSNEPSIPQSVSQFDINNAIVISQITADSENNIDSSSFYIAYGSNVIKINSNGVEINASNIIINGNTSINGNLTVSNDTTIGGKSFLNHTNGGSPVD